MNILVYSLDIAFVAIVVATAVVVSQRMMVESALLFLALLLSSLVAMTVFEPLVDFCNRNMFLPSDIALTRYLWILAAVFIFLFCFAALFKIFFATFNQPTEFNRQWELVGCWTFGLLSGYLLAAFMLTLVHTLPLSRNFGGVFEPDARLRPGPIMAFAPDYQFIWLADCVCRDGGFQLRAASPSTAKKKAPKNPPRISKERLAWFPVRYANWREKLTVFDGGEVSDMDETETTAGLPAEPPAMSEKLALPSEE